ncbi:glycosyltransferase family 9 protein [Nocardioides sp. BP30]|uniref:glycosyltransferase family 9 protein n=1 Tax=Nocardioides sp. BP30 TaxID=3036374 RepID=UPI002468DC6C|nr:glycosyltransferase family 9 protein [Nocardioides sp. BP30]WGL53008.1 glycosyltransferase family 9 protein [Nocardioides sp. BP30]
MSTLAVRLDSLGDLIVTGPALRALAREDDVTLLCGRRGRPVADLLPGVGRVLEWTAPWIDPEPEPVDPTSVADLQRTIAEGGFDRALIFTSFHQSPLPTALILRLAGVPWVGAISVDYPGSLLDLRVRDVPDDLPEHERALRLARAAGCELPPGDEGLPALSGVPEPDPALGLAAPYVVLHPGTSVPARAWPAERFRSAADRLVERGHRVVVTGSEEERMLTKYVADGVALDLGGSLDVPGLAAVLAGAACVVVGNTGPAHLAAAVGTPVVSLFAPTVPAVRWAPRGAPVTLLGDQDAPCRGTRATTCPIPGHPCLAAVTPGEVVDAVEGLCGRPGKEHR